VRGDEVRFRRKVEEEEERSRGAEVEYGSLMALIARSFRLEALTKSGNVGEPNEATEPTGEGGEPTVGVGVGDDENEESEESNEKICECGDSTEETEGSFKMASWVCLLIVEIFGISIAGALLEVLDIPPHQNTLSRMPPLNSFRRREIFFCLNIEIS